MITLDHIGIAARDAEASARFLSEILGVGPVRSDGPDGDMYCLSISDSVSLLYSPADAVTTQHIAFRVDEETFIAIADRLRTRGVVFGNDPENITNGLTADPLGGSRRVYFLDPNFHLFEVAA
ncbi:MAG: VOC family protein [Chloracidobacterium sp.]|nr:VOC family protein [Chloracidobacterium sp.]